MKQLLRPAQKGGERSPTHTLARQCCHVCGHIARAAVAGAAWQERRREKAVAGCQVIDTWCCWPLPELRAPRGFFQAWIEREKSLFRHNEARGMIINFVMMAKSITHFGQIIDGIEGH